MGTTDVLLHLTPVANKKLKDFNTLAPVPPIPKTYNLDI
jgi:hypothetical protein